MKIHRHKHHPGLYVLHFDDGRFAGASIGSILGETAIVWYSGTAELAPNETNDLSFTAIRNWVKELGGNGLGGGMCTKDQNWSEWRIPISFEDMLTKYLV